VELYRRAAGSLLLQPLRHAEWDDGMLAGLRVLFRDRNVVPVRRSRDVRSRAFDRRRQRDGVSTAVGSRFKLELLRIRFFNAVQGVYISLHRSLW